MIVIRICIVHVDSYTVVLILCLDRHSADIIQLKGILGITAGESCPHFLKVVILVPQFIGSECTKTRHFTIEQAQLLLRISRSYGVI